MTESLGEPLRTFPVDSRRRGLHGVAFTVLGGLLLAAGIPAALAYIGDANATGYSILPGALLGLGFTLLGFGVLRLAQSIARPGERFVVHETGFVQHTRRRERAVPATDLLGLTRVGQARDGGIVHSLGLDFRSTVFTRSHGRFAFNSYTEDAERLASALRDQARTHGTLAGAEEPT